MTQEEKAKAYDEALKQIKRCSPDENGFITIYPQEIFPELRESEDERIRKELIFYLRYQHSISENFEDIGKWIAWLEKQGEQKQADKVEPKFHEGEWIVFNGLTLYVKEVVEGYYRTISKGGIPNSYGWDIDNLTRLWTIQDAKNGDVLSDETTIFIFKDLLSDGSVMSYCDYDTDSGESDAFCPLSMNLMCSKITPATKEQRDALMKEMADAGYTFDFEKKKLKKIEQKYTPKHKVGDTIYYKSFGKNKSMVVANVVTDSTDNSMYEDKEGNAVFEKDLIKQNPAWSKKDKEMLNVAINSCEQCGNEYAYYWLKSLKERVQPKQEWSMYDETILKALIDHFEYKKEFNEAEDYDIVLWLKSLRPQNTWKPSDEQIEALKSATNIVGSKYKSCLNSLYSDLKKLREE